MSIATRLESSGIDVFAAVCSASLRTSLEIGLPLILLSATRDVGKAIEALNLRSHGSGTLHPEGPHPFLCEDGWDDWRLVRFDSLQDQRVGEASLHEGVIRIFCENDVRSNCVTKHLQDRFRELNFNEIVRNPRWIYARSDLLEPIVVHPRYVICEWSAVRATLVENLFAVDLSLHSHRVMQEAVAAVIQARDMVFEEKRWASDAAK